MDLDDLIRTTTVEPRPYQTSIITRVLNAFTEQNLRSVLVESPTGSGKKGKGEKPAPMIRGGDGAAEMPTRQSVLRGYHTMAGNPAEMYGLANLNALSAKRQRTLPAKCTVYDMINFVSEVATHHAVREDSKSLQAFLGDLISTEYDLEGTVDHFPTWKDFFLGGRTSSR